MMKFTYTVIMGILCLFFATEANAETEQPWVSPFAATKLLTRPDESAEEILIRAHQQDARAIALAITGYAQGIGGFPKDQDLAATWGRWLGYLGDIETMELIVLQIWPDDPSFYTDLGARLANCDNARESPLAPLFEKADILHIDTICAPLTERKANDPTWEKNYQQTRNDVKRLKQELRSAMLTMRELRDRPATPQDWERLREMMDFLPMDVLLFYAATTHEPTSEAPNWDAKRLLSFFGAQSAATKDSDAPQSRAEEMFSFLVAAAPESIIRQSGCAPPAAVSLIRDAHGVNVSPSATVNQEAMRTMSQCYRNGTLGFVKDSALARAWLRYAALENDYESIVLLSVALLAREKFAHAWAWAANMVYAESAPPATKAFAEQVMKISETAGGKDIQGQGRVLAARYSNEQRERLEWRIRTWENKSMR